MTDTLFGFAIVALLGAILGALLTSCRAPDAPDPVESDRCGQAAPDVVYEVKIRPQCHMGYLVPAADAGRTGQAEILCGVAV